MFIEGFFICFEVELSAIAVKEADCCQSVVSKDAGSCLQFVDDVERTKRLSR